MLSRSFMIIMQVVLLDYYSLEAEIICKKEYDLNDAATFNDGANYTLLSLAFYFKMV